MKILLSLLTLLFVASCSTVPETNRPKIRGDVLYYQNTEGGRRAAREVTELYGGRQEIVLIDQKLPEMELPVARFQSLPVYPAALKAQRVDGTVNVDFIIDETGSIWDAVVIRSTNQGFNASALDAIRKWKFKPAQRGGVNVRARLNVPIYFDHGT